LKGAWRYIANDDPHYSEPGFNDSSWSTIPIPLNWFLAGLDHHGVVWFRREFHYRRHGEFFSLHFDGVDYYSDVYLNGEHLGHHIGYFDPFEFDVTKTIRPGKNILAVRVDSPYEAPGPDGWHMRKRLIKGVLNHHDCRPGGGWEPIGQSYNTGGIWNRVHIEQDNELTIDHLLLRADMNSQPNSCRIKGAQPVPEKERTNRAALHSREFSREVSNYQIRDGNTGR
jgi:beta-mannosidase